MECRHEDIQTQMNKIEFIGKRVLGTPVSHASPVILVNEEK